jgi:hypothetical protein
MKTREYIEGPEALENFERGMKAVFQVPKADIVALKKKSAKRHKSATSRKPKTFRQEAGGPKSGMPHFSHLCEKWARLHYSILKPAPSNTPAFSCYEQPQ